jgi:hypothetical protein
VRRVGENVELPEAPLGIDQAQVYQPIWRKSDMSWPMLVLAVYWMNELTVVKAKVDSLRRCCRRDDGWGYTEIQHCRPRDLTLLLWAELDP